MIFLGHSDVIPPEARRVAAERGDLEVSELELGERQIFELGKYRFFRE